MLNPVFESIDDVAPDEFEAWVQEQAGYGDPRHYELLNGRIVMTPPAGWPHGEVESNLVSVLLDFVRPKGLGKVFGSSQGFVFPSGDIIEPDVSYVSEARWRASPPPQPGKFLHVVPELIMEIASPGTTSRDRGEKRGIYERNRVSEYWLVDTRGRRVSVLSLSGESYAARVFEGGRISSALLPGFEPVLESLFPA